MESFGPEWVEDVMSAVAAVRPTHREYRNPYNRIYEAVARCQNRTQAEQLVRAVLDLRLDGQDAAQAEIKRLRAIIETQRDAHRRTQSRVDAALRALHGEGE